MNRLCLVTLIALLSFNLGCNERSERSVESNANSENALESENSIAEPSPRETFDEGSDTDPERKTNSLNSSSKKGSSSGYRLVTSQAGLPLSARNTRDPSASTKILGAGSLYQVSRSQDSKTFENVGLSFSLLYLDPTKHDSVTVVPTEKSIPGLTVKVSESEEQYLCERSFWELSNVSLDTNHYSSIRQENRSPFDVIVIQPPVSYFKHTDSVGNLASATLDSMFYPGTLEFAIDVSGDGVADVAKTRYCCDDASVHPDSLTGDRAKGGCYRCSSAFHRNDEGAWERTYSTGPC